MATICPVDLNKDWKGLNISTSGKNYVYGLGQQFIRVGSSDGDWTALGERTPGDYQGNQMTDFNGGANGNTQFPIMYVLNDSGKSFALFFDNVYKQSWNFRTNPWEGRMWGDQLRFYILSGNNLAELRQKYMELVGRPLVPPKKMFGLWVSEYGFDNWEELESKLSGLRSGGFPVDGFVMDLQWFGGVQGNSENTNMGVLRFDTVNFPNAAAKIEQLETQNIGLMLIEESYIGKGLQEHSLMQNYGYLAKKPDGSPVYLDANPWWGKGGMIDWSNAGAGRYWHNNKRQPLIDMGILGHWTDLGEPEMYDPNGIYQGVEQGKNHHADIHNLFSLLWHKSIYNGYQENNVHRRPFILSRSGGPGMQRYGAGMWSGDIGSRISSLATHMNAQMHMSFSGIDYYGSDIGGFHRTALDGDLNELYTQWFANSAWFDVPVRPHTMNLENNNETSPHAIGNIPSNLANLRQRYELIPYYYSLAHRAHRYGEPVIAPMVYYFENDPKLREMGHEKMIGKDILVAIVAKYGETTRDVYLPAGTWINYHTNEKFSSSGQWVMNLPEYREGLFRLPTFVREGAILPIMQVNAKQDAYSRSTELRLRIYPSSNPTEFIVYEDDGQSVDYLTGRVQETKVTQIIKGGLLKLGVSAVKGS